ncbi:hypothetical protein BCV69DRAFT_94096 [Microstroma glucosiphilum]|uniref:Uncharacterized protein n=1 Tax=Pseudomicrostroma glucosiphilum TaxID=1684307 RepID=A0A316UCS6_9BASI|nr:hypothetical protein BCV69DRAFT_94096 [Pseudomicrostroma glucosiphilum]PWN22678.1 hypothetical protein BCV69DRAFT_94096 [Pseudomicrostroma glucosiphilum]
MRQSGGDLVCTNCLPVGVQGSVAEAEVLSKPQANRGLAGARVCRAASGLGTLTDRGGRTRSAPHHLAQGWQRRDTSLEDQSDRRLSSQDHGSNDCSRLPLYRRVPFRHLTTGSRPCRVDGLLYPPILHEAAATWQTAVHISVIVSVDELRCGLDSDLSIDLLT